MALKSGKRIFKKWVARPGSWLLLMGSLLLAPSARAEGGPSEASLQLEESFLARPMPLVFQEDTVFFKFSWLKPQQLRFQYAGLIGFASVGLGYEFTPRYSAALYYGVLSDTFGGSSVRVHTVSIKSSWRLFREGLLGPVEPRAGFSLNWGNTNNTFRRLPAHYPEKYYFQNKLHLAPFWGAEWALPLREGKWIKGIGLYAEMSTLDAYVLEMVRTRYVGLHDIWNLALGITLYLD